MKICFTNNSARCCDRTMDDCDGCIYGSGTNVVEQLTTSEMAQIAWSWHEQTDELSIIISWLLSLYKRSKLGDSSKTLLIDQLRRLLQLESDIMDLGNKLFVNLMFYRDQENSREDAHQPENGSTCGEDSLQA